MFFFFFGVGGVCGGGVVVIVVVVHIFDDDDAVVVDVVVVCLLLLLLVVVVVVVFVFFNVLQGISIIFGTTSATFWSSLLLHPGNCPTLGVFVFNGEGIHSPLASGRTRNNDKK